MKTFATSTLAAALALAGASGIAATANAAVLDDGLYVVDVHQATGYHEPFARYGGCMIVSNGGYDLTPSMYYWANATATWCGLANTIPEILSQRQAVWQVHGLTSTNGVRAYVIKSYFDGRCLIRGENGTASAPELYLWTALPGGDARYCGMRSADELIANGQAAWNFSGTRFDDGHVMATSLWNTHAPNGLLSFVTTWYTQVPNTVDRSTFAGFTSDANSWFFTFWPVGK
jgi:hypothetical protein